jgi:hypothetical protein
MVVLDFESGFLYRCIANLLRAIVKGTNIACKIINHQQVPAVKKSAIRCNSA